MSRNQQRVEVCEMMPLDAKTRTVMRAFCLIASSVSFVSLGLVSLEAAASPQPAARLPAARLKVMPTQLKMGQVSDWSQSAHWIGGEARVGFTISDMIYETMRSKPGRLRERWSLVLADRMGAPWSDGPAYFHAVVSRGGRRLTVDLTQVVDARRAPMIEALRASSKLLADLRLLYDSKDGSASLVFDFRHPVAVRVAPQRGESHLWVEAEGIARGVKR